MSDLTNVEVISQSNRAVGQLALPDGVFGVPVREHLLHEVVLMQLANRRAGTHSTKTRAFVSGGGKKPWRQKGTGRARAGSSRSPIWVGGATIFGPQPRDYSYRMPKSSRRAALASALSAKLQDGRLKVVDQIVLEQPKTKVLVKVLSDLQVRSALIITAGADEGLERAARNLPHTKILRSEGANVYDILRYEYLILTRESVEALERRLAE